MELNGSVNPRCMGSSNSSLLSPKGSDHSGLGKSPSSSSSSSSSSSFSSSPSSSSSQYFLADGSSSFPSPLSPSTPSRVPFSWEKLPGIPKRQTLSSSSRRNTDDDDDDFAGQRSLKLLPFPPSAAPATRPHCSLMRPEGSVRKFSQERDPFVAALMKCSKDEGDRQQEDTSLRIGSKVSRRSIVDHFDFGFIGLYASCKTSCAVDESTIRLGRPKRTTAAPTTTSRPDKKLCL
ncbi:hypothetical protein SAY87_000243 [Trapa incisa]|uniref:Uncharacterized protein n=1 Tax=Trapa incisa TaxID=236973 RepID=A0AAN7GT57_9MYRT|nr:hypothetical protein SAY87_000243 [Trapa incisa]